MNPKEASSSICGYAKPPWVFKGSAIYQLNLVKAETARAFIPKGLRLVEAFGYTLGGFFLASYDDSPVGSFDELVVIAGIVWNPPTSCAWAARVLVNSDEACTHGQKDVGLPSQVARFSKRIAAIPKPKSKICDFINKFGMGNNFNIPTKCMDIQITETKGTTAADFCNVNVVNSACDLKSSKWKGPVIKMSLPSFSGRTEHCPHLLKYSCQIECRVRPASPAKVSRLSEVPSYREEHIEGQTPDGVQSEDKRRNLSISVLLSKPILALQFNRLKMQVESPVVVSENSHNL